MNKIKIPFPTSFNISYSVDNELYYNKNSKATTFFNHLLDVSEKRCMYCGNNLQDPFKKFKTLGIDHITFDREHTIERKIGSQGALKQLTSCKYNFGVACSTCNNIKKISKVDKTLLSNLNNKTCLSKCSKSCTEYDNLLIDYKIKNNIIPMPKGIKNNDDIIYDTENLIFDINHKNTYTGQEKIIIENHIAKFLTYSDKYILLDIIQDLREHDYNIPLKKDDILKQNKYRSIIADRFIDDLQGKNYCQIKIIVDKIFLRMKR